MGGGEGVVIGSHLLDHAVLVDLLVELGSGGDEVLQLCVRKAGERDEDPPPSPPHPRPQHATK